MGFLVLLQEAVLAYLKAGAAITTTYLCAYLWHARKIRWVFPRTLSFWFWAALMPVITLWFWPLVIVRAVDVQRGVDAFIQGESK